MTRPGGMAQLRDWWLRLDRPPLTLFGHPAALDRVRERHRRLEHCEFHPVEPGQRRQVGGWSLRGVEVPHARGTDFPTVAWRIDDGKVAVVYASDVARPVDELRALCRGAQALVLDGATWRRRIFTHLRIDEDLPVACGWQVHRIWLTQIGRSAPPHQELARAVSELCGRAAPAYDGLKVV